MLPPSDQILTVAQMRMGEQALIAAGSSVDALMQTAGRGAADWVWRFAAGRKVTVLCGPGNNGGDGYVIAEALRERGGMVSVIAANEPNTDAARNARTLYQGAVQGPDAAVHGEVLVDCFYGSGLTRALAGHDFAVLSRLAASHRARVAVDLPSGIASDSGAALNAGLPDYQLTLALGAWKQAHFLMPGAGLMGALRLVEIGMGPVTGAAWVISRPQFSAPAIDAHKYRRGLLGVVSGDMPGAALLAAQAAQGAGAGYVKLLGDASPLTAPDLVPDLVTDASSLVSALADKRWSALLIGPGLGRGESGLERLLSVLCVGVPTVVDADGLRLLNAIRVPSEKPFAIIATPHEGELLAMEQSMRLPGTGSKADRARSLATASGLIIVAKGADTVIAAPDGRTAFGPRASSWLSTAGTGDVLAGVIASRLATGVEPFTAACQGVWLHGEAARLAGPALSASMLAAMVRSAYAACL